MSCVVFYITNGQQEKLYCLLQPEGDDGGAVKFFDKVQALSERKDFCDFSVICEIIERDNFSQPQKTNGPKILLCAIHTDQPKKEPALNERAVQEIFGGDILTLNADIIPENERVEICVALSVGLKLKDPSTKSNPLFFMRALHENVFNALWNDITIPHDRHLISSNIPDNAGSLKSKKM